MKPEEIKTGAYGLINSFLDLAVYIDELEKDNRRLCQELETANELIETYEEMFVRNDGACEDCKIRA